MGEMLCLYGDYTWFYGYPTIVRYLLPPLERIPIDPGSATLSRD